jgi:acyl-CoA thioesterase FadM
MTRIKLQIPENEPLFSTIIELRITDMNYGGHMGNEVVLVLAHEARMRWLQSIGQSEMNLMGKSIIQADAAVVYQSEGYTGDRIEVLIYVQTSGSSGFEMIYQMKNLSKTKDLAVVKTGMVFYNYELGKVERIPEGFEAITH